MPVWNEITQGIKTLLYAEEKSCLICGKPGTNLCEECEKGYFPLNVGRCRSCGKLIPLDKEKCGDCQEGRGPKGLLKVTAWGHYTGQWREVILNIKFKAQPYKLEQIAKPFANWAIANLPPPDGIVPVPLSRERLAQRGYNQAEVLTSLLKWQLALPVMNGLKRVHDTPSQVNLSRKERLLNLEGAFEWDSAYNLRQKRVWLVDDVTTTGATLERCAQALYAGGATEVYGLCLAAGIEKTLVTSNK